MSETLSDIDQIHDFIDMKGERWVLQALHAAQLRGLRFDTNHTQVVAKKKRVCHCSPEKKAAVLGMVSEEGTAVRNMQGSGVHPSTIMNALSHLVQDGKIEKVAKGFYRRVCK